ncbi:MAG TPA: MgtC/SapB family protein, partial [Salinimicrobium sp.]|nr:MgtC/SapB family protein [Salinimicrobium sp.]
TGIGFIGAGVIIQKGGSVSGLTTAATVWCSAGAGCLAAIGEYHELMLLTIIIVFINVIFGFVENYIHKNNPKEEKNLED